MKLGVSFFTFSPDVSIMEVMISPDDSMESIRILEAEIASADMNGQLVYLS